MKAASPLSIPGRRRRAGRRRPTAAVRVWSELVRLPTYLPAPPDRNPMFLEKRVYQGSSGKVYPLPFTDRIATAPTDRAWRAVWLENDYLRVMILPELGGRVHVAQDKTNGYDFIYRQAEIKPALVGLAGPWISGGIEFNWPQHHRPATFLLVATSLEEHPDGAKTVWLSDHDPMCRMKGMHGVCLHPDKAYLELKVRVYNRTPLVQTFLWWANVATRVHEAYESFFPPDVFYVADHAKRATSQYPLCQGLYYGVDFGRRGRAGVPPEEVPTQFIPPHCGGRAPVNYAPNDLSWYANIPTPCSYMAMGSQENFFGGYDSFRQAGLVHLANHHIAPGKKQWTWGNHQFGYAWDRNLTDTGGPYIELMAGVYTDNQPDFSFLQPGETKTWSQFWYPIQKIGPAQQANLRAAVNLHLESKRFRLGVSVTQTYPQAVIRLARRNGAAEWDADLSPGRPFLLDSNQARQPWKVGETTLTVFDRSGHEIIAYTPQRPVQGKVPPAATEPPSPEAIKSADELFLIGLHLEQYRHATRCPTLYWREALRRDPLDARCANALGLWHLRRGEFTVAETHFRAAITRLTQRNPNPYDGEPYYNLGLCLRYELDALPTAPAGVRPSPGVATFTNPDAFVAATGWHSGESHSTEESDAHVLFREAYAAFYKATWNQAWQSAAYHALAELDCRRADWGVALDHLDRSLRLNTDNLRVRNLRAIVLQRLGRTAEVATCLRETLALDPLDFWARYLLAACHEAQTGPRTKRLAKLPSTPAPADSEPRLLGMEGCDAQTALDLAHDFARAGFYAEAIELLQPFSPPFRSPGGDHALPRQGICHLPSAISHEPDALPDQNLGTTPLLAYTRGWLQEQAGELRAALRSYGEGAQALPDYCFPARLEEIAILESALRAEPSDARAAAYLGNLLYDRRRHQEAIKLWERSAALAPAYSVVWRNLGIGYFNARKQPNRARSAYERAFRTNPKDARLLYERDQLWKRLRESPRRRRRELEKHLGLVGQRDDLSLELCTLYNQTGQPHRAQRILQSRHFQPWEGGEGLVLGEYVRTQIALGRSALNQAQFPIARDLFQDALNPPAYLGEARHLLANPSDVHYWLGVAQARLGDPESARAHWQAAAQFRGDFQQMQVRAYSEMTFYSALALQQLGQRRQARQLLRGLLAYARKLERSPARIEYFATSLPTMLLFDDDLPYRQHTTALLLEAQAWLGLGQRHKANRLLRAVLRRDPSHGAAADLLEIASARSVL